MTIHTADLSSGALATIRSQLTDLAARPENVQAELAPLAGAAAEPGLEAAAPHEVYNLSLQALAKGDGLEAATPVGVRALITSHNEPIGAVELPDADGAAGAVTSHGPFTQGTADALQVAEDSSDIGSGEFELRLLRVPALYLMTLWLKDREGGEDLFVPLDPAPAEIEAGSSYSWPQLGEKLRSLATQQLDLEASNEEPGPSMLT